MRPVQTPRQEQDRPIPMLNIPTRLSLTAQTVSALRKGILDGTWKDILPSERHLCELLKVSRPTIRAALKILADEGLISIRQGCRNRITAKPGDTGRHANGLVVIVTHESSYSVSAISFRGISEIRASLAQHGFNTDMMNLSTPSVALQIQRIEAYFKHNQVLCCVLVSVAREIQQWFARHNFPSLVLGSCHDTINLPSVDIAYHALCRHAAGVFFTKGHRHIALVRPVSDLAGDLASDAGFKEALENRPAGESGTAAIIRHNGTGRDLRSKLDIAFNSATPPTALLVRRLKDVLAVMLYLLKRGLAVPDSVSLIASDYSDLFDAMDPPIAHYRFNADTYSHRLSRLVLQLVTEGRAPAEPHYIFPDFIAGGTIREVSAQEQAKPPASG